MAIYPRALSETATLAAGDNVLYTAPVNTRTIIDKLTVTNITAGAVTVTLCLVPNGGTVGTGSMVANAVAISPRQTYLCPEAVGHILAPGDMIVATPSAAATLTARASGREVS